MDRASYEDVRDRLAPGDVIAFRGHNWFSRLVAWAGGAGVSHVGLITWRPALTQQQEQALDHFSYGADKRRFDVAKGIRVVVFDLLQRLLGMREAWKIAQREVEDYFCSELVATGLLHASVIAKVNPNVTPARICSWRIYRGDYWLLKGGGEIHGYNTMPLESGTPAPAGGGRPPRGDT